MAPTVRNYQNIDDNCRTRQFLAQVCLANDYRERSWLVQRWDYWTCFINKDLYPQQLDKVLFLWETADGDIAAVLNPENPGNAYLQVHPGFRSEALEEEMIKKAEDNLSVTVPSGGRKLAVWCDEDDRLRKKILGRRGYALRPALDVHRRRVMSSSIDKAPVTGGYTIRALGGEEELPARSYLSWRAFHPDEPEEKYQGWEWYRHIQSAPLYRRELDLVAVVPDGGLAAFCTVWYDSETETGYFEPVGCDPSHQRRGLARGVMSEGLRRLRKLGAKYAFVSSWNEVTHRLYGSLGFERNMVSRPWLKQIG